MISFSITADVVAAHFISPDYPGIVFTVKEDEGESPLSAAPAGLKEVRADQVDFDNPDYSDFWLVRHVGDATNFAIVKADDDHEDGTYGCIAKTADAWAWAKELDEHDNDMHGEEADDEENGYRRAPDNSVYQLSKFKVSECVLIGISPNVKDSVQSS